MPATPSPIEVPMVPIGVSRSSALTKRLPPTRFSLKASIALMMSFIFCFLIRFRSFRCCSGYVKYSLHKSARA